MNARSVFVAVAALIGLLGGLALGGVLRPGEPAVAPSAGDGVAAEIAALREDLTAERNARLTLATEVAALRWAVEQMAPDLAVEPPTAAAPRPPAAGGDAPEAAVETGAAPVAEQPWFDESVLATHGYEADDIARMRERFDAWKMDELYLRDQAVREGWALQPRMFVEMQNMRRKLRQEIGDDAYDLMLYASGSNNRVVLVNALATSPAESANLQRGDVIVRYGDENIYSVADLKQATRRGEAGSTVAVEVLRDGSVTRVFMPRGPLGARLRPERLPP